MIRRVRGHAAVAAAVFLVLVVAIVARRLGGDGGEVQEFVGPSMGTLYTVSVDADVSDDERTRIAAAIDAKLDRVIALMSTYDPDSEISRFNRHESTEPFALSPETMHVLLLAKGISERSRGAFDVTVAPLVDAWGFGPSPVVTPVPDSARLAEILPLVGHEGLVLDPATGTAAKRDPRMRVDPTAIAQGYAAEAVADTLRALGLERVLVDVGGELRAVGRRRDGSAWRVGIERPDGGGGVAGTIALSDEGIDTSGDYRNYFEEDGVRYAHLIDPRNGRAVRVRDSSVTVVHDDTAVADAWATALMVLGPEEGWEVAVSEGLAAVFLTAVQGRIDAKVTPAMGQRFQPMEEGR
jgi:thiamine biosynthesis lipoprotein